MRRWSRGGGDTFVCQYGLVPTGITRRGAPTSSASGSPTMHAMGDVTPKNPQFGFACSRVQASTGGVLMLTFLPSAGLPVFNATSYVDFGSILATLVIQSNAVGEQVTMLALPPAALPTLQAQYFWVEDPNTLTLSASDALQLN